MTEIERKFLVTSEAYKTLAHDKFALKQGYLNTDPERSVRVRIKGEKGFLTVKGKSNASGTSRFEWEKEISLSDAEALMCLCEPGAIHKTRHLVEVKNSAAKSPLSHTYEVDEFHDENQGLVVAEVELLSEDEVFTRPDWLEEEVTGDSRYYNSALSKNPFENW